MKQLTRLGKARCPPSPSVKSYRRTGGPGMYGYELLMMELSLLYRSGYLSNRGSCEKECEKGGI
jgi:hypothetical protein